MDFLFFGLVLATVATIVGPIVYFFKKFAEWRDIQRQQWQPLVEELGVNFLDTKSKGLDFCAASFSVDGYPIDAYICQGIPVGDGFARIEQVSEWRTIVVARHSAQIQYYMSTHTPFKKGDWFSDKALNKKFETVSVQGELPDFPVEFEGWLGQQHSRSWLIGSPGMTTLAVPKPAPNAEDLRTMLKLVAEMSRRAEARASTQPAFKAA